MTSGYNPSTEVIQLPTDKSYISHEKDVSKYWNDIDIIEKTKLLNENGESFDFMDGPPFVSGNLHLRHLGVGTVKDGMRRFQTMSGKKCKNKLGFDCHGLPIESVAMKELGLTSNAQIESYGVDKFNEFCKRKIKEYAGTWEPIFNLIGRDADFKNTYKTMDLPFMETAWWVFNELSKKGLVYRGFKVMPYSWSCETPLSNFEAGLNYKDIDTKSVYVCFKLRSNPEINLVAWTTTPWTLPSNLALCVNPNANYVMCTTVNGKQYVVAEESVNNLHLKIEKSEFFSKGCDMVGLEYEPLFDFLEFKYHKILADTYVKKSENIGTGIVHIAPALGEDDCRICLSNGVITVKELNQVCPITSTGTFSPLIAPYAGTLVFDADTQIIKDLVARGLVVRTQNYKHSYPFCWRKDTPLIYMSVPSFFIKVTEIKDKMIEMNEKINWSRKEIGTKRFKNWLENVEDWSVSRNRYFGTPLPVFVSEDGNEMITIGSIAELVELAGLPETPTDIHKEFFDKITFVSKKTGNVMRSVGLIFDCWYESGCVPYGQIHYPFENEHYFDDKECLSEFVVEGIDQTRGWFYTLLAISTAISGKPPFKNVICTGMILDENGKKISKKYGNFVDPSEYINEFGADIMRLYLIKSPLVNAEPLWFNKTEVGDLFQRIIQFVNSVKFFLEHYMNAKKDTFNLTVTYITDKSDITDLTVMDLWILERVTKLRKTIEKCMNGYQVDNPVKEIVNFVEDLTNWYVKFNRDRMKGLCGTNDRERSLSTMYTILRDYILICAPFMPFLCEHLYHYVVPHNERLESVHFEKYPVCNRSYDMDEPFERLKKVARLMRSIRSSSDAHQSVKTPIKKCTIFHSNEKYLEDKVLIDLIQDELNCLDFEFATISGDMFTYQVKPNFKSLRQKYKNDANGIKNELALLPVQTLKLYHDQKLSNLIVSVNGKDFVLDSTDFEIVTIVNVGQSNSNSKVIEDESLLLCVDLTYDLDVHEQSQVRKFISFIQNVRKRIGLRPWNKITINYDLASPDVENVFEKYQDLVMKRLGIEITKLATITECKTIEKYSFGEFKEKAYGDFNVYIFSDCDC